MLFVTELQKQIKMTTASALSEAIKANFLDSSGGTMNGALKFEYASIIPTSAKETVFAGDGTGLDYGTTAGMAIRSNEHSFAPNSWVSFARNKNGDQHYLELRQDGSLTLDGKNVLTSAGGVLNGALKKSTLGGELQLAGGTTYENGAAIALYGGDCTTGYGHGQFLIRASSSSGTYKDLVGNPNGNLTWGGKNVLCSTEQNIQTNGYVKFSSGLMIQWGVYDMADGSATYTYTFPTPFPNNCFSVAVSSASVSDANFQLSSLSRTGFSGWYGNTKIARWIAIGN